MLTAAKSTAEQVKEPVGQMLINVCLTTGETNEHVIELPNTKRAFMKLLDSCMDKFEASLEGEVKFLFLPSPLTYYSASSIVSIGVTFTGPQQLKESGARFNQRLGFKPPTKDQQ